MAFISSSRSKVFGAWNAQFPEPMQRSRSTFIESGICPPGSVTLPDGGSGFPVEARVIDADAHVNEDPLS